MIKQQIKYGIKNKKFIALLIIGILIHLFSIINEIAPYLNLKLLIMNVTKSWAETNGEVDDVFNKYSLWCDSVKSYMLVIPILSAIPFATSYVDDIKSDIIQFINLRINHRKYIISKLISNSIIGGAVVAIPTILCTIFIFLIFNGSYETCYVADVFGGMYNNIFKSQFILYLTLHLVIEFFIGATYASIALAISTKTKNNIAILLSPFIFYLVISVLFSLLNINYFSPERIHQFYYNPTVSIFEIFISLLFIYIISSILFLKFSKKEYIYEKTQ